MSLSLKVKRLEKNAILPVRGSPFAAGYDLSCIEDFFISPRGKGLIRTGLAITVPRQTYGRLAPRSGLAWKNGIDVGAGVIDEDYLGEVKVVLFNHSDTQFEAKAGERIAQLILEKIETPEVEEVETLEPSTRGEGGFGSTGTSTLIKK